MFTILGCGVTENMLEGTREFSYVFSDFLSWVNKCAIEVGKVYNKLFYPGLYVSVCFLTLFDCSFVTVLVAHNGFNFDYRILAAEVERRKLEAQFLKADLGFADTLYELRKVK